MKVTKQEKDKYPESYGYGSIEDLLNDTNNPLKYYIRIVDGDGHVRFIPCTEDYFHKHRNENRNEERREMRAQERTPISTDKLQEKYDFEFADPEYEIKIEQEKEQEQKDLIWKLVSEFSDKDQLILKLFNDGHTDAEIAEVLNLARSTVQERRVKVIKQLKEKYKKIQK